MIGFAVLLHSAGGGCCCCCCFSEALLGQLNLEANLNGPNEEAKTSLCAENRLVFAKLALKLAIVGATPNGNAESVVISVKRFEKCLAKQD